MPRGRPGRGGLLSPMTVPAGGAWRSRCRLRHSASLRVLASPGPPPDSASSPPPPPHGYPSARPDTRPVRIWTAARRPPRRWRRYPRRRVAASARRHCGAARPLMRVEVTPLGAASRPAAAVARAVVDYLEGPSAAAGPALLTPSGGDAGVAGYFSDSAEGPGPRARGTEVRVGGARIRSGRWSHAHRQSFRRRRTSGGRARSVRGDVRHR